MIKYKVTRVWNIIASSEEEALMKTRNWSNIKTNVEIEE